MKRGEQEVKSDFDFIGDFDFSGALMLIQTDLVRFYISGAFLMLIITGYVDTKRI